MFNIPVKEIIVNDDSQVQLLEDDGTAYADNDVVHSTNTGGVILQGFLNEIIWCNATAAAASTARGGKAAYFEGASGAAKMLRTAASAGVAETAAWTVTAASGGKKGDTYRLVIDSLDLTPTEYQNRPVEKRYMLGVDCANAVAVIAELVTQINADVNAPVTAYAGHNNLATPTQNDSDKIVLVAKTAYIGCQVNLYVGSYADVTQTTYTVTLAKVANGTTVYHTVEDTSATTALPALPVNTYAALKNVNFAKNFHIDRDVNWMPLPGASYNSYYFQVNSGVIQTQEGNQPAPNQLKNSQVYGVRLYVKSGLTLDTALNLLDGDLAA